jgi:hypothetical protein
LTCSEVSWQVVERPSLKLRDLLARRYTSASNIDLARQSPDADCSEYHTTAGRNRI